MRLRNNLGMADLFGATLDPHSEEGSDEGSSESGSSHDVVIATELHQHKEEPQMLRINLGHGDCCDIPASLVCGACGSEVVAATHFDTQVLPTASMPFRGTDLFSRQDPSTTSTTIHRELDARAWGRRRGARVPVWPDVARAEIHGQGR